jgi:hypothetical protein
VRGLSRRRSVDRFEFDAGTPTRVLEALAWLAAHRDGWVNLLPGVESDAASVEAPGLFSIFGAAREPVSMVTWMPPGRGRHALDEVTLGIMHGRNHRVVPELVEAGLMVPPGWRVWGDHPRRGLVIRIPTTAPDAQVLKWALDAGAQLCLVPLTGSWQAEIYQPLSLNGGPQE